MKAMMDQWTDKSDPYDDPYYDPSDDDNGYYDEDDLSEDDTRGLHYGQTPIAAREPYCWLVRLPIRRRTIETINLVRRTKKLPTYHPQRYEPPEEAENDSSGSESKEIIGRVRDHMEQLEKAVREGKRDDPGPIRTIGRGALFGLGGLFVTAAAYGVRLVVKANELLVRSWIDQFGGSQTLHWIVDVIVGAVPGIG